MSKTKWPREAKTERGEKVVDQVLSTAQSLLQERWLGEISIRELAKKAGVERASLLFQFPAGWSEISAALTTAVLFGEFDRILIDRPNEQDRHEAHKSIEQALMSFVDLSERTGKLVPNLRSQMFVWGPAGDGDFHRPGQDFNQQLAEALACSQDAVTEEQIYAAECLVNSALDIAGGAGLYPWTAEEQRRLLVNHVEMIIAGLDSVSIRNPG